MICKKMNSILSQYPGAVFIVAGEGEIGRAQPYTGKRTAHAIALRLARERCHGDRWARAYVQQSDAVFIEMQTGEYCGQSLA
jgi:hypothetical protein